MRHEFLFHEGDTPNELLRTLRYYISHYPNGVVVTVEPYKMKRTAKQNGQYQVLIKRLSAQSGLETDQVKRLVKEMAVGYNYPVERDEDGEPILKYGYPIPISTSQATVEQMQILIECCYKIASKYGYVLTDV